MKIHIKYKKKIPYGFIGMNREASGHCKVKWKNNNHTIEIKKGLPKGVNKSTIAHEKCELYLMKNKNYNYKKAHKLALNFEKLEIPFPSKNIKQKLKKVKFKYEE
ncbi:MAG: hypothetical protein M0R17_09505 [Candidatus Omnitrophica bacterium]|jgi:hypothetical protein|nr:hypothetical protein [Candidatus Omnitrophota bacterium]